MDKNIFTTQVQCVSFLKGKKYQYSFLNDKHQLIAYITVSVVQKDFGRFTSQVAYINDITTANGYEYLSEHFKKIYNESGVYGKSGISHFGATAFQEILETLKKEYPTLDCVVVNARETSVEKVGYLLSRVKEKFHSILHISGGSGEYAYTLKI